MKLLNEGWWFILGIVILLFFPLLFQKGMFLDGITYAVISNNWSMGEGTLTEPHYTQTLYPIFHEHPPLFFFIQGLFFKLLGASFFVERIFSFFSLLVCCMGIHMVWNLVFEESKKTSWLPCLIFVLTPIVTWSFNNNMIENTLTAFMIFACYFSLKGLMKENHIWMIASGLCIVCGFFTKGFVALFPLVIPTIYGICFNKRNVISFQLSLFAFSTLMCYLMFVLIPGLYVNFQSYLDVQLLPALKGQREITVSNRFSILSDLLIELFLPIIILIGLYFKMKKKKTSIHLKNYRKVLFFFLIGLCASIPLIITLKQRKFYLVPSLIFFTISFSLLIIDIFKKIEFSFNSLLLRTFKKASFGICILGFIISAVNLGNYSRDQFKIQDIETIHETLPSLQLISLPSSLNEDWSLHAYFARINNTSLNVISNNSRYILAPKSTSEIPGYKNLNLDLNIYTLFQKNQ